MALLIGLLSPLTLLANDDCIALKIMKKQLDKQEAKLQSMRNLAADQLAAHKFLEAAKEVDTKLLDKNDRSEIEEYREELTKQTVELLDEQWSIGLRSSGGVGTTMVGIYFINRLYKSQKGQKMISNWIASESKKKLLRKIVNGTFALAIVMSLVQFYKIKLIQDKKNYIGQVISVLDTLKPLSKEVDDFEKEVKFQRADYRDEASMLEDEGMVKIHRNGKIDCL